ncbi:MAG: MetS family NSS transporter small subunit [Desulfobacteraceae bacterium]|nr:MetS family NSS transporter small subunit [Desulfobacteraceae bacterium]
METGAICTLIVFAIILVGGLVFCFTKTGKGGKWED